MLTNRDVDFLELRIAEELRFAEESIDPSAALVHRKMAAIYSTRIIELQGEGIVRNVPFVAID